MKSYAKFNWTELLEATQGRQGTPHRFFETAHLETDTRHFAKGDFYVPLKGESFDGQDFIEQAFEKGATGAFVESAYLDEHPSLLRFPNLIVVDTTLKAYQDMGRFHRHRCKKATIIAITGSSGKTTTKEMMQQFLSTQATTQCTEKNYNNEVGVPYTLLQIRPETRFVIVEMAMRGLGQIEELTLCAEPDIAMVTNIGPAHIGILGSLQNIAKAKCEIFKGLDPDEGIGIINNDDPLLIRQAGIDWSGRLETFSLAEVDHIKRRPDGGVMFDYNGINFYVGIPGRHNVMNTLACIKVCEVMGLPLKKFGKALTRFRGSGNRWVLEPLDDQWAWIVINDAYNANPDSMQAALEAFIGSSVEALIHGDHLAGEPDNRPPYAKVAVLGEMNELGEFSYDYHKTLGEWLSAKGHLDLLVVVGAGAKGIYDVVSAEEMPSIPAHYFETNEAAAQWLVQQEFEHVLFLVKGSRSCRLESLIAEMKAGRGINKTVNAS